MANVEIIDEKYIYLGLYPQNGLSKEPIKWKIVNQKDDVLTVISDLVLFNMEYDTDYCNYESSSVRKYIINEFINDVFTKEELSMILDTKLEEVIDKVFVPALSELKQNDLIRMVTPNAILTGVSYDEDNNGGWYWTRTQYTPSYREPDKREVCMVSYDGKLDVSAVWATDVGVVLMMRVRL